MGLRLHQMHVIHWVRYELSQLMYALIRPQQALTASHGPFPDSELETYTLSV